MCGAESGLESNALAKESASHRQSDVLMTEASQSVIEALSAQVAALTEQMKSMQNNNNSSCYYTKSKPRKEKRLCEHCGMNHVISEKYGCFGKAMADGKLTEQEALYIFKNMKNPHAAIRKMKE